MTAQPLLLMTNDWRSFEAKPGVYEIHFPNGLFYIGKSINVRKRLAEHYSRLKRGKHDNPRIQNAFNKYNRVYYNLICYCDSDTEAAKIERLYIANNKLNKKCANVANGDWVLDADCIEYFTKPTLWVHLPSGNTHKSPSRSTWSKELGYAHNAGKPKKNVIAINREHAKELHEAYWQKWIKDECYKHDKHQLKHAIKKQKKHEVSACKKKRWWYHMKNTITGRATLARNTYEWKKYKLSEGWICRRYGEEWPKPKKKGTPPKAVQGYHPTIGSRRWVSIGACAREINRTHMSVLKTLTKEHNTCASWNLSFCDD